MAATLTKQRNIQDLQKHDFSKEYKQHEKKQNIKNICLKMTLTHEI